LYKPSETGKLPNGSSETLLKPTIFRLFPLFQPEEPTFYHFFFVIFVVVVVAQASSQESTCRTGKHHGSEGRRRPKKAAKNCLTSLLKPLQKLRLLATFQVLFAPAPAAAPDSAASTGRGNTMAVKDGEGTKKQPKTA